MNAAEMGAMEQVGFPILTALILLPVLLAGALSVITDAKLTRTVAVWGAFAELVLSIVMVLAFVPGIAAMQFVEKVNWIQTVGIAYHIGVDGISVLFIPLTALVTCVVMLFSCDRVRFLFNAWAAMVLLLEAVTIGVFVSLDLILFFAFWELMLVPTYFLVKLWGVGPQRQHAGFKYVMYMLVGSTPMVIAILLLGLNYRAASGSDVYTFDLAALLSVPVRPDLQTLIFFLLAFGFAVKVPLFPFHTWMPTVVSEGPVGLSVLLVALKVGIYGFLRVAVPLVPQAALEWSWLLAGLGTLALLYAGLVALQQRNLRRLLAFAAVSHAGLAMLGVFSLNVQGVQGALILVLQLGVSVTGLLLLTWFLYTRLGSSDVAALGGIAAQAPILSGFFFVFGLAAIGTPGTSGFVGEFLVLLGAFRTHTALAAAAVLGIVVSAAYFLAYYERAFAGQPRSDATRAMDDLRPAEAAVALALAGLIFWIGLFPRPFLSITEESVRTLVNRVEQASASQAAMR